MMSMLNQAAVEALCSATYLENYLDCMENLPDDIQRIVSQLRELDSISSDILDDLTHHQDVYLREGDGNKKQRALMQIQRGLIRSQEIGDEKLQLVAHIIEHIENRSKQLEQDLDNLEPGATVDEEVKPVVVATATKTKAELKAGRLEEKAETPVLAKAKRPRRQRVQAETTPVVKEEKKSAPTTPATPFRLEEEEKPPRKKKKRRAKQKAVTNTDKAGDKSPLDFPIDPDEPRYCLCDQVSYGEMIGCDNDSCAIEWFHFNCVGLTTKPKGKWFCPNCRGDKPTVKRPDLK